jgi:hypothetical protein
MREKALGGADTASRAKVVWQVKVKEIKKEIAEKIEGSNKNYAVFLEALGEKKQFPGIGKLKAQAKKTAVQKEPCLTSPESTYRGAENQLYRVEIHKGGETGTATFKWSRENGSVIFPILDIGDKTITLEHLGRDDRFGLQINDWVEVLDDDVILRNEAHPLLKVKEVDRKNLQVTLDGTTAVTGDIKKHPYLRRWDQKKNANQDGVIPVMEGNEKENWILLEDDIDIQFQKQDQAAIYQTGDCWLIPARTATGDVEWPGTPENPEALLPHGVVHHYAPLAIITVTGGNVTEVKDLRRQLHCGWTPTS